MRNWNLTMVFGVTKKEYKPFIRFENRKEARGTLEDDCISQKHQVSKRTGFGRY